MLTFRSLFKVWGAFLFAVTVTVIVVVVVAVVGSVVLMGCDVSNDILNSSGKCSSIQLNPFAVSTEFIEFRQFEHSKG